MADAGGRLADRFIQLHKRLGGTKYAGQEWERIRDAYSGETRHYHSLVHLSRLFELIDPLELEGADRDCLELVIFYHDLVYVAGRKDNEELSASELFGAAERLGWNTSILAEAAELIRMSSNHQLADMQNRKAAFFLDADQAVLGSPPADYQRYAAQIRKEYARFPDRIYKSGRIKFLERCLLATPVFQCTEFAGRFEAAARRNMQMELEALRNR